MYVVPFTRQTVPRVLACYVNIYAMCAHEDTTVMTSAKLYFARARVCVCVYVCVRVCVCNGSFLLELTIQCLNGSQFYEQNMQQEE